MRGEKNKWVLTWNSRRQLSGRAVGHVHNGRGSLVHHHLILVPQAALNEVKQGAVVTIQKNKKIKVNKQFQSSPFKVCDCEGETDKKYFSPSLRLIQQLAGDPDEHAVGKRRLQTRFGELV